MKTKKRLSLDRQRMGRLSSLMAVGMLAPAFPLSALAAGIAAVTGSGTGVATQNGVPVVNIVAPSASGLSHNRYTDFNVGTAGAVFNNSLSAGTSQLAGQLQANGNLQGHQANVILNEVVTANPSQLLGQQEIFGQRADLVLANPNGITCNGCGFINVSQATLAVATPNDVGGVLKSYTVSNPNALLQTDGTISAAGTDALTLIAPSARLGGNLQGGKQVSVVLGKNTVDAASGQVTASDTLSNADRRYDSTLFGAMQAGRIQVLSTSAGVGVNLVGAQLSATDIKLSADQVNVHGAISQTTVKDNHSSSNWWNWGRAGREYLDSDETDVQQNITRSKLNATGSLSVTGNDTLTINAADLNGKDVTLAGRTVALGTEATTETYRYHYRDAINWWSYQKDESRDTTTQNGARISASGQLRLDAGQSASLNGAQLAGQGDVRITAGTDLTTAAAINTDAHTLNVNEVNNTIINNSASSSNYNNQSLLASTISAGGELALSAGHDLSLNATQATSTGDTLLSAGGALKVDAQSFQTAQSASSAFSNTGGLFGGYDNSGGSNNTLYEGSSLQAGGKTYLTATGDVRVRGSRVKAGGGVYAASQQGGIGIDVAKGVALSQASSSNQTLFNITTSSSSASTQQQVIKGSDLQSDADIKLISATDTAIIGSLLSAAQNVGITAAGGLTIANTTAQGQSSSTGSTTQGYAQGGATGQYQYQGGVGIQTTTTSNQTQTGTAVGSTVQAGGNATLASGQTVAVTGSSVQSGGDVSMTGQNVTVSAAQNTVAQQSTTTTVSGGVYGAAGVDKIATGVEVNATTTTTTSQTSTAVGSTVSAGGNVSTQASGTVTNQGSTTTAGGAVSTQATTVSSVAATNTSTSTTTTDTTHVDVGVAANTGVGGPVASAITQTVTDAQAGKVTMPIPTGAALPTVTAGVTGTNTATTTTTSASSSTVSTVQAGSVDTQASGTLTLQGTQTTATGGVNLSAGTLNATAATSQQQTQTSTVQGSGGVTATLTTSGTVNLATPVSVQTSTGSSSQTTATGATVSGGTVNVAVAGNATLVGTQVQSQGNTTVNVGGDLLNTAGTNSQATTTSTQGGSGQVGVSMVVAPVPAVTGASGSVSYQQSASSTSSSQAVTGSMTSGGNLTVSSGGNTVSTGTLSATGNTSVSAGGDLTVVASHDLSQSTSSSAGVNAGVSVGLSGSTAMGGGGNLGFQVANSTTSTNTASASQVTAGGTVALSSGGNTTLTGTQVQAATVNASTGGSLTLQSAQSTTTTNGGSTSASVAINASPTSGSGDLKVATSSTQVNQVNNLNTTVSANTVQVQTGGNVSLTGATVTATSAVNAQVGGNLSVTTQQSVDQSQLSATSVDVHVAAVPNPQPSQPIQSPILDKMGSGVTTAVNTVKQVVDTVSPYIGSGVAVTVNNSTSASTPVTQASGVTAPTVDATVAGSTTLMGGQISGSNVALSTTSLSTSNVASTVDTSATHVNLPVQADPGAIVGVVKDAIGGQMPVSTTQVQTTTAIVGGVDITPGV